MFLHYPKCFPQCSNPEKSTSFTHDNLFFIWSSITLTSRSEWGRNLTNVSKNKMWIKCGNTVSSMNICLSYINNGGDFTTKRTAPMIKRQNWRTVPLNAAGRCLQARLHINYSSPSDCDGGARHPANSRSLMCFLDNSEGQRSRGISCTGLSFSFGLLMGLADKKKKKKGRENITRFSNRQRCNYVCSSVRLWY